jgi:uncharacterized membrane protein
MWIKMNDEELLAARKKKKRADFTLICVMTLTLTILESALPRLWSGDPHLTSLREFISAFIVFLVPMFLVSVIGCYLIRRGKRPEVICPKCEVTKYDDGALDCSCGGRFEILARMKWVKHHEKHIGPR